MQMLVVNSNSAALMPRHFITGRIVLFSQHFSL